MKGVKKERRREHRRKEEREDIKTDTKTSTREGKEVTSCLPLMLNAGPLGGWKKSRPGLPNAPNWNSSLLLFSLLSIAELRNCLSQGS